MGCPVRLGRGGDRTGGGQSGAHAEVMQEREGLQEREGRFALPKSAHAKKSEGNKKAPGDAGAFI
jgi:hypothetical protein